MKQVYEIPVVVRTQDNQDGGYSIRAYNNEDELIQDHPKCTDYEIVDGKYKNVFIGCSDELREEILSGEDEYENGYISNGEVKVEVENGVARLCGILSFHAGQ
jgi:hypothetical protein